MNINFFELMQTGGPLMWVIFSVAFYAFSLITWQFITLIIKLRDSHKDYVWLQHNDGVIAVKESASISPVAVLSVFQQNRNSNNRADVVTEINIKLASIVPELEAQMGTIATLGSLLPMLGLLGTVLGMINVFDVIAIHGSGKPEAMAEGISQALLTTASGLVFAIPVIFMHHVLSKKLNEMILLLQQAAQVIVRKTIVVNTVND